MNQKPDMKQKSRLAINSDWTSDINDPRNAPYLRPLSIAADEEMANSMAEWAWSAAAEERDNNPTFNSDELYRQCLIDARRMLRDREYWGLFGDDEDFSPPLN